MSSCDKREHKALTLSAKAEIIKELDKGEELIILLKSQVLDVLRYTISGTTETFFPTFSGNPAVPWSYTCRITKIVLCSPSSDHFPFCTPRAHSCKKCSSPRVYVLPLSFINLLQLLR
jgi:hypothetical protein